MFNYVLYIRLKIHYWNMGPERRVIIVTPNSVGCCRRFSINIILRIYLHCALNGVQNGVHGGTHGGAHGGVHEAKPSIKKNGRQPPALKDQSPQDRDWPPSKRPRLSSSNCTAEEKLH